jgi:hypothetical protein
VSGQEGIGAVAICWSNQSEEIVNSFEIDMDSEVKEFLDYLFEVSYRTLELPRKFVKAVEDIISNSEMTDVDGKFSE